MIFKTVKKIVEDTDTAAGRVFDLFIELLILVSLISFSIETIPDLGDDTKQILSTLEIIIIAIFTAEYLLRLIVADRKLRYIFSFYGLIDLAAILPFYIALGVDLRSIRIIRILRLLRAFKFLRFGSAMQRFKNAFLLVKGELVMFGVAAGFMLFVSSVGIYYFENPEQPETFSSVFSSMWWAVATLTTVGYGDIYPVTVGGKIFTSIMLLIGLGIIAVPTGLIASALTKTLSDEEKES